MTARLLVLGVSVFAVVVLIACGSKSGAEQTDTSRDSTALVAPATMETTGTTSGAPELKTSRRDSVIGRDSAFGPTAGIDPSGKVAPIKRPPR